MGCCTSDEAAARLDDGRQSDVVRQRSKRRDVATRAASYAADEGSIDGLDVFAEQSAVSSLPATARATDPPREQEVIRDVDVPSASQLDGSPVSDSGPATPTLIVHPLTSSLRHNNSERSHNTSFTSMQSVTFSETVVKGDGSRGPSCRRNSASQSGSASRTQSQPMLPSAKLQSVAPRSFDSAGTANGSNWFASKQRAASLGQEPGAPANVSTATREAQQVQARMQAVVQRKKATPRPVGERLRMGI
jgi:hypothetical protein